LYVCSSAVVDSVRHRKHIRTPSRFVLVAILVISFFYTISTWLASQAVLLRDIWPVLVLFRLLLLLLFVVVVVVVYCCLLFGLLIVLVSVMEPCGECCSFSLCV
jgi:hypothetical protein